MSMKTVAPVRVVCSFLPSSPREAVFLSPSFSYFLFFDSRREQDINNFARREITRKNCPPRGLSYYINSHHIDGILSAFRRDCFSNDVARRARLIHDATGERRNGREREKEKEILRFWNPNVLKHWKTVLVDNLLALVLKKTRRSQLYLLCLVRTTILAQTFCDFGVRMT